MAVCTVTGNIRDISNALKPGAVITFARREVVGQDGKVVVTDPITATADGSGNISVALYSGNYQASYRATNGIIGFTVAVPEAASAALSDLIGAPDIDVVYPLVQQTIAAATTATTQAGIATTQAGIATSAAASAAASLLIYFGLGLNPDFWIDSVNGNDANSGTSPGEAWQSLSKIGAIALGASVSRVVRVEAGTYLKSTDFVQRDDSTSGGAVGAGAVLTIVFDPGVTMDGTNANVAGPINGFEFSGANTWTANIFGNGLRVNNYNRTGSTPNGVGNRNSHILNGYDIRVDNADDGFSAHQSATMNLYDCSAQNCTKAPFTHIETTTTKHRRCTFTGRASATLGLGAISSTTATAVFEDCVFIPNASGQLIDLRNATMTRCQIGTLALSVALSGTTSTNYPTITNSFVNLYADGNVGIVMTRCFGLYSARVRNGGRNDVDNCVFSGPATGQTAILFSNFSPGSSTQFKWKSNIFETASALAFMNVDATNAGYLVTASAQMFNNILSGSAAFDADLIAADTGPTVRVSNVTADALIGAANTLLAVDYGYATGSPAIGAGVGGTNSGFPVTQTGMVRQVRSPALP